VSSDGGAAEPAENASATVEADEGSDGLAIAALVLAVVALVAAGASFLKRRTA
jgi:hypothetical protein